MTPNTSISTKTITSNPRGMINPHHERDPTSFCCAGTDMT